ncbi:hypothetical protein EJ08DRAFT_174748 [Tothia fuscella]|uniref:Zn(2)-C6 fungal-type domain-containing protein n=1 Tax=Tothia fuscella TaxID=1048955 RepID=A0A9P4NT83_9PEZI|nr:hypothetical protein EJ08DRAFT_174748 [Tothia fuscella]
MSQPDSSQYGAQKTGAVWTNPNPPLHRGRVPKDPLAQVVQYDCASIDELETKFREYLANPPAAEEHCTCELTLWAGASFLVAVPPDSATPGPNPQFRPNAAADDTSMLQSVADAMNTAQTRPTAQASEMTMSVLDALQPTADPKESMKRQRAISKVCVAAVQRVDGFRYSFHNNWRSGEDNAYRFSYYCNDSLLNKDRVANGKAGSQGRRATKPVYDCKGVLSIKFSATRSCIDVVYKHIRCHETYENRAPPPRKESRRRAEWEESNPGRQVEPRSLQPNNSGMGPPSKKRQRKEKAPRVSAECELRLQSMKSLLELMRDPEEEKPPEQPPNARPNATSTTTGASQRAPPGQQNSHSSICAICLSRRARCDGAKPKCKACSDKDWPCFYTAPAPSLNGQQMPANATTAPGQSGGHDFMQQNAITALAVASQNEDLQQSLNNTRQELLKAQKETYDLRTQLTESQEEVTRLQAEIAQHNTTQVSNSDYTGGRGNSQPQQLNNVAAPSVYQTPSYQTTTSQMYQNHQTPSQTAHRIPSYTNQNARAVPWQPQPPMPAYGYQTNPQPGMWNGSLR